MNIPFLQIEPTNICNLKCIMCSRSDLKNTGMMTFERFRELVDNVPGLRAVKLQGMGEPMLHPDIIPMMQYLRKAGIHAYTATNGTVFPKEGAVALAENADRIEFSIDTADSDKYLSIRGIPIDEVVNNLRTLCVIRKGKGLATVSVNSVLFHCNVSEISQLINLVAECGAGSVNFNILQNWRVNASYKSDYIKDYEQVEKLINKYAEEAGISAILHKPVYGFSKCKWSSKSCYITWDGYVTPCCQRPNPDEINFGNGFEQSITSIYESPRYAEFRAALLRDEPPLECISCSMYYNESVPDGCAVSFKS